MSHLVDVKVGEVDTLVGQLLRLQAEGPAGEPDQPVTVQIDGQRVQAGQQHVQPAHRSHQLEAEEHLHLGKLRTTSDGSVEEHLCSGEMRRASYWC